MKLVKLTSVVQDLCNDYNVSMFRVLETMGAIDKRTEQWISRHLTWEMKICADPRHRDPKNIYNQWYNN
eukprot:1152645-Amphidinium_carterae.1